MVFVSSEAETREPLPLGELHMLTLPEELLLLALDDDSGAVVSAGSTGLAYGLAGAVLMELSLRERIRVTDKEVKVLNPKPTKDPILDLALDNIRKSSKVRAPQYWLGQHAKLVPKLQNELLYRLVSSKVLTQEDKKFLWTFTFHRYPPQDAAPEQELRRRIHDVILHNKKADETTSQIICLVHACGLAKEVFPNQKKNAIVKKLKAFAEGDAVSGAVSKQITAALAAVMVIMTTTTIASSGR